MTKTELLSTYTAEQLAEMAVTKNDEIQRLKRNVSRLSDENGELQIELDKYNNYILPRCTKEAKEMIDRSRFGEVMIVTYEEWGNKKKFGKRNQSFLETIDKIREYTDERAEDLSVCGADLIAGEVKGLNYVLDRIKGFELEEGEIEDLKGLNAEKEKEIEKLNKNFADIFMQAKECTDANLYNINRFERQVDEFQEREEKLQSEVEKYRKAFEDAKKERDCQIAEYQKKIEELTAENKEYLERIASSIPLLYGYGVSEVARAIFGYCNANADRLSNKNRHDYSKELEKTAKAASEIYILGLIKCLQGLCVGENYTEENVLIKFLPTDPIKIADILINAEGECEPPYIGNDVFKDTCRIFDISELRQIAEHLLVYCKHNGKVSE